MPILVPTGSSPSLADFTSRVRTDLFDAGQRAGEQPRWADSDLQRALDRANDKYSSAAPYLKQILTQTFPGARRYAVPADAWFVDQVEYPYGAWPTWLQPFEELLSPLISAPVVSPAAAVSFSNTGNTDLNPGAYSWYVSFVTPGGETTAVLFQTATAAPGSYHQALLSNLPIGPYGVTARNLYRTAAGGTGATLVTQIQDNTTTTYLDSASDASIAAAAATPAGNTTQGVRCVDLQIDDSKLPSSSNALGADPNWGWLRIQYAAKHELDANGTTIPERHWD